MRLFIATLGLLATAATAHADPNNNELTVGSSTRGLQSSSANALTASDLDGGGVTYARQLPLEVASRLAVWAEAGFGWGSADGTMFKVLTTELDTTTYTLGARARYTLHPRVVASGRVAVGVARTSMSLADMAGHSASDTGTGGLASGAIGLDLLAIAHRSFALGLR
ncbi:MAG: hypothetical protein H0T79_08275, partial [Deltaproteobacteria bacterium]|nr:hypothetical protein [Deltaproteobacteria bacterium]